MPENTRFLLGYGERLTGRVPAPPRGRATEPAYSFEEAVNRLTPQVENLSLELARLPTAACPENEAVGVITLHPQALAKSYHPQRLLNAYNLRQVGSRPVNVLPDKWTRIAEPDSLPSTELYVAGDRRSFAMWSSDLERNPSQIPDAIQRIEEVHAPRGDERIRGLDLADSPEDLIVLEIVLHASAVDGDEFIIDGFAEYAETLGVNVDFDRMVYAGGLCFMPAEAPSLNVELLAQFAFLRIARPLSRLRSMVPIERAVPTSLFQPSPLPDAGVIDLDLRVAVFDGGVKPNTQIDRWIRSFEGDGVQATVPDQLSHGHSVTSALLFGSLESGVPASQPYGIVDHYRVLDDKSGEDPYELYDVLRRINTVLSEKQYEFFNLSIGPAITIEDDDVHPWTAVLDSHLSDGHALAAIAVGNNGESVDGPGGSRIQVPSDCVNGLALGSADTSRAGWKRAPYSAYGPGRSPGRIKPDILEFGGGGREPFVVYEEGSSTRLALTQGTSFASPAALRRAVAIRAHFGKRISPLALKALLIHSSDPDEHPRNEVGWGRTPVSLAEIMLCNDGEARIIYQGELMPGHYMRARIPLPPGTLQGRVNLAATFCYATVTDPQDPGNYTRSGLEITFRPHAAKYSREGVIDPQSKSFFKHSEFDTEQELRGDAHKWETVLHRDQNFLGTSLYNPVFDVHYNARTQGGASQSPERIRYALVVTITSKRTPDLYDQVVRAFTGQLEALRPIVEIPIQI